MEWAGFARREECKILLSGRLGSLRELTTSLEVSADFPARDNREAYVI